MAEEEKQEEKQEEVVDEKAEKKKSRRIFWLRFFFWILFGCVLPFSFIAWRFKLFAGNNHLALSGWGVIAILLVLFFALRMLSYVKEGINKFTFLGQCINGLCKVIVPLILLLIFVHSARTSTDAFIQALSLTIVCECIAIPMNPLPGWILENVKEEERNKFDNYSDLFVNKIFSRKKDEEK